MIGAFIEAPIAPPAECQRLSVRGADFGAWLRRVRQLRGWNLESARLLWGLSDRVYLSNIELGRVASVPRKLILAAITSAEVVGLDVPPWVRDLVARAAVPANPPGRPILTAAGHSATAPRGRWVLGARHRLPNQLRPGRIVTVYRDPPRNLVRLGQARLIRHLVSYSARETGWLMEMLSGDLPAPPGPGGQAGIGITERWLCT